MNHNCISIDGYYRFIVFIWNHIDVVYVLKYQVLETKLITFILNHVDVVYVLVLQAPETKLIAFFIWNYGGSNLCHYIIGPKNETFCFMYNHGSVIK